ncbi:hypothetical protein [Aestuariivita boseongensis]|uniref:hypothetical protein n=1 Tax=Aestuariivita boseongensis TaxID=1470562 RepID=UPI000AE82EB3|nr:hypothetical protein [Aestuariivita boseongensis]
MSKVPKETKNAEASPGLGVRLEGSAEDGHQLILSSESALKDIFATDCDLQANALIAHCLKVLMGSEAGDAGEANDERGFMLSIVKDIEPRDAVERMLAVQMATTHVALVRQGNRMAYAQHLPQFEAHEKAYNKLARTFTAQVEALRKNRNGGKQTVTVQHVNVEEGGQAIVGNVATGGEGYA